MKQTIVLSGRVPSKKNSRRLIFRGGRPISLPSENHEAWHREKLITLKVRRPERHQGPVAIEVKIWAQDKRPFDGDNVMSSILDLLKDAEIIKDDKVTFVPKGVWEYMGVDRESPRVEVTITSQAPCGDLEANII